MNIKKIIFTAVGGTALALGALGAALPILPTTPFLLLSACCFAKSNERLDRWFKGAKLYQENLASYTKGEGMPQKAKLRIMLVITLLMGFGFAMMGAVPVARAILAVVWLCHILYFIFGIKTL